MEAEDAAGVEGQAAVVGWQPEKLLLRGQCRTVSLSLSLPPSLPPGCLPPSPSRSLALSRSLLLVRSIRAGAKGPTAQGLRCPSRRSPLASLQFRTLHAFGPASG